MKRTTTFAVVAIAALLLVLGAGVVLAASINCDGGGGDCLGTREDDQITGFGNPDRIAGMEGDDTIFEQGGGAADNDEIFGDEGNDIITDNLGGGDSDVIYGDEGNDTIDVDEQGTIDDTGADTVDCGPGKKDKVFADSTDILTHCEIKKINQPH